MALDAKVELLRDTERALSALERTMKRVDKALVAEVRRVLETLQGDPLEAWRVLSARETRKVLEECAQQLKELEWDKALELLGGALVLTAAGLKRRKAVTLGKVLAGAGVTAGAGVIAGVGGALSGSVASLAGLSAASVGRALLHVGAATGTRELLAGGGTVADALSEVLKHTPVRMTQLEAVLLAVDSAAASVFTQAYSAADTLLQRLVPAAYYREIYALERAVGLFNFPLATPGAVARVTGDVWWDKRWSDALWGHVQDFDVRMKEIVREGVKRGLGIDDMAAQLQKLSNQSRYNVRRLVRTEAARCSEHATLLAYEESGVERYRYLATLDLRTSAVCRSLDGQEFAVEKAQSGVNYPPMHPNCRSTTVAVVEGMDTRRDERYARDPVTGGGTTVPADWDYARWYKERVVNNPQALAVEKMTKNRAADAKQYARYGETLGKKNLPGSLDDFQRMKYTEEERYSFFQLDYKRQKELALHPEKALPNAATATAADEKFTGYIFNKDNPDGWAKGVAFTSRLGYDISNWQDFRKEVLDSSKKYPSIIGKTDEYGTKCTQLVILYGKKGAPMNVKIGWKTDKDKTWMTTIMPKEV